MRCTNTFEQSVWRQGFTLIAGLDEAGRGSLFGPVYAAAVILDPRRPVRGLADSKVLAPERRAELAVAIKKTAVAWAVGAADAAEIDRINIYHASRLAMQRAVAALRPAPDFLLIDALTIDWPGPQRGIVNGDARVRSIAAASILAKTSRDACMDEWDRQCPGYGLARHKGYSTPQHLAALLRLGPTAEHRRSFAPVVQALQALLQAAL
jgi:ribonuclease HII